MTFWKWSRTAASNATADSTCPFPEGMAPSALNDGTRGMMAAASKYRDDIAGAIVTTGTLNAYAVSSYQGFGSLTDLSGQMIAFTPHATNGDTVTLSVDGLASKPLRPSPGVELVAGTLILGTPYTALYNSTDGVFYLRGYHSSPYNVPFLGGMDFWDTVAPNSAFIFPQGQEISRTVYARAFNRWGTQFGVGNGSTTFNAPDKTGRVSAMMEIAPNRLTGSYFGGNSAGLGGVGGLESHLLSTPQIPNHNHTLTDTGHDHGLQQIKVTAPSIAGGGSLPVYAPAPGGSSPPAGTLKTDANQTGISIAAVGGGGAHNNVQPTIVCNYIIRII